MTVAIALLRFGSPVDPAHKSRVKLILLLMAVATIAQAQTAGSNYKLTHQTLATSSPDSIRTIQGILANHNARKFSEWDQETIKLYQQNDIRMLGRGTTVVVDKIDPGSGVMQFHLPGAQSSKPLYALLEANGMLK
jgi:hypothetical protein